MENNQHMLDLIDQLGISMDSRCVGPSSNPHFPSDMHDLYKVTIGYDGDEDTFDFHWPNWKDDSFGVETVLNALFDDAYSLGDYPDFDPDYHNDRESFYDIVETERKLKNLFSDKYDVLMYGD